MTSEVKKWATKLQIDFYNWFLYLPIVYFQLGEMLDWIMLEEKAAFLSNYIGSIGALFTKQLTVTKPR